MPELSVVEEPVIDGPAEFFGALDEALILHDPEQYRNSRVAGRWAWRIARTLGMDDFMAALSYTSSRAYFASAIRGAFTYDPDARTIRILGIRDDSHTMLYDAVQVIATCGYLSRSKRVKARLGSLDSISAIVWFVHCYLQRTNGDREHEGMAQLLEWLLCTTGVEHHPDVVGAFQRLLGERLRTTPQSPHLRAVG